MSTGYRVQILGYIDEWKLPTNGSLPSIIRQSYNFDVENMDQLNTAIERRITAIIASGGMRIFLNPDHRDLTSQEFEEYVFVPIHMITFIRPKVQRLQGELPIFDRDENTIVTRSGEEPLKQ